LATRAVEIVSRWAIRDLALARLALLTEPSNRQSPPVAEATGFQEEGVLRSYTEIDGRRVDYVSFSLCQAICAKTSENAFELPLRYRVSLREKPRQSGLYHRGAEIRTRDLQSPRLAR
jgi:hypothetical protein